MKLEQALGVYGVRQQTKVVNASFKITGPGTYRCRDGQTAVIREKGSSDFPWSGRVRANGLEIGISWKDSGSWLGDGRKEPHDLVERLS